MTPNFFSVLGVKPVLGRIFLAGRNAGHHANRGHQQRVLEDASSTAIPDALGKTFTIEGVVSTVVGVMPAGFAPFYGNGIDLWKPINPESSRYSARIDHWLMPVGRLKPGVTFWNKPRSRWT